jgi:hypothetical protein
MVSSFLDDAARDAEKEREAGGSKKKSGNQKGKGKQKGTERLRGIIVPHAGYIYSGPVAAYAYNLMRTSDMPRRIVIIGPSHYAAFPGLAESGYAAWSTPLGDIDAFSIMDEENGIAVFPPAHEQEHSLEVQLPFLQVALEGKPFTIDPILTGEIGPKAGAEALAPALEDAFLVVSSDLSHYMPYGDAVKKDARTLGLIDSMDAGRFLMEGDACGRSGIAIAIELARMKKWKIRRLRYANSGDTAGPKSEVVGYAALAITE